MLLDFDGTLSPIVLDPAAARPDTELIQVLEQLQPRVRRIAVISGRDRATLQQLLPEGWVAVGSYGLELPAELVSSTRLADEDAREALDAARAELEALLPGWPGARIEIKPWGVSVHLRGAPSVDPSAVDVAVRAIAASRGLELAPGRLVFELRPSGTPNKGDAVRGLVDAFGPTSVIYAGDDVGDKPAFEALRSLSSRMPTLAIGLASGEIPENAMDACDIVLTDRAELTDMFRAMLSIAEGWRQV